MPDTARVSKRVAVVGAGPSGLVTVKELLAEGHDPVCFERASGLGGVFRYDESAGVVWDSCRLTSSGLLTAFSDFPVPEERAGHMRTAEYVDYLTRYCETFGVSHRLRFDTSVEQVARTSAGGWAVRTRDARGEHEERFDAVAVCSGLHQHPHLPRIPGSETFTGATLHGAQYRRGEQVVGRRVLVVGAGESGADVVAEVSRHARETVLALRRGVAVLSRSRFGQPRDYLTTRLHNCAAHWIFQTRNPADDGKRSVYRAMFLPLVVVDKLLQLFSRCFWEYLPLLRPSRLAELRSNLATRRLTKALLAESGGTLAEQFGTKDDDFVAAMAQGRCRRAPGLARFEGARAIFDDGTAFEPDLVIFCTGFETRMPFLSAEIAEAPRYLHTFHPEIGAELGFIGFLRPALGAIPPLAELQARWFALVTSGARRLPDLERMRRAIERWSDYRAHVFRAVRGRLDALVDHTPFCDELAQQIGCKPTWNALRRESFGFRLRFFAAPFVAAQYRMIGPHAKPELARRLISALPIEHPFPEVLNLYLRWTLSRGLHRLLGPAYTPKLALD